MRFDLISLTALAALLLAATSSTAQSPIPDVPTIREPHPPIVIDGDAAFSNPLNGVRSGDGSPGSPYRISGWEIEPQFWRLGGNLQQFVSNVAIRIRNTTKHVIIDDNRFYNGGIAIQLQNVRGKITIIRNQSFWTQADVSVEDLGSVATPATLEITNNELLGGVSVSIARGSADVTISGNTLAATSTRTVYVGSLGGTLTIQNNTVGGSPEDGAIYIDSVGATTSILGNDIICPGPGAIMPKPGELRAGIYAQNTGSVNVPVFIYDNEITNCRHAVRLAFATATVGQHSGGNCFTKNMNGVLLEDGSGDTTINHNDFLENQGLAILKEFTGPPVIDAQRNYWNRSDGPNHFGEGPERTYPHLTTEIDFTNHAGVKQAPLCGR